MSAIAQFKLLDDEPAVPQQARPVAPARPVHALPHRQPPCGRQMRLQLVPRAEEAERIELDARDVGRAAARLSAADGVRLVEFQLRGIQAVVPTSSADERAWDDGLLIVAPCATAGTEVAACHERTVVVGRRARSERLAGSARIEGAWLWLTPLAGDGAPVRLPVSDVRIWGEVVTLVRRARQGTATPAMERRSS